MTIFKKIKSTVLEIRDNLTILQENRNILGSILESNNKIVGFGELG
jgi:hypothetical protein